MAALPCEDVAPADGDWRGFLGAFGALARRWPAAESAPAANFVAALETYGCATLDRANPMGAIFYRYQMDPCRAPGEGGWQWQTKPLSYFCPAACGCRGGEPHCPDACPANATHWWDR